MKVKLKAGHESAYGTAWGITVGKVYEVLGREDINGYNDGYRIRTDDGSTDVYFADRFEVVSETVASEPAKREPSPGKYEQAGKELGALVDSKQAAYGDSFGKSGDVLRLLYPNGVQPEDYGDMLALVRIVDKAFRIATNKDAFGESPFLDISGYGLLGAASKENK